MWKKFREIDTERQQLVASLRDWEEQEALACERADQVEEEVVRLTKEYGRLAREKGETCICSRVKIVFPPCRGVVGGGEKSGRRKYKWTGSEEEEEDCAGSPETDCGRDPSARSKNLRARQRTLVLQSGGDQVRLDLLRRENCISPLQSGGRTRRTGGSHRTPEGSAQRNPGEGWGRSK